MPVKSFFLPDNALQGEEIPSYILWKNLDYDKILIKKFNCCDLKDIFNVNKEDYSVSDNIITINKVAVDGYIGLLFKTERTKEINIKEKLHVNFMKGEISICDLVAEITLFKPELEIIKVPEVITVNNGMIDNKNKISISNIGDGTCRIVFKDKKESEIKLTQPKRIKDFIEGYQKTFNEELELISSKYVGLESIFEDFRFITNKFFDPSDEVLLKEYKEKYDRLEKIMDQNEDLAKDILRVYVSAIFKNIHMITVIEQFLDYLQSIQKNRVELLNSLDTIEVNKEERFLILEIHYTDLLNNKIEPIILKPIKIKSNKETDISIYNLFSWDGVE